MNSPAEHNSITYSRAIARQLCLSEKEIWRLLVGTRITADRFIYDDSPISSDDQKIIFQNTLNLSQDNAYGLQLGKALTPPAHGSMGFLANCSPTLYTALDDFSHYLPTRVSFGRLGLRCTEQHLVCLMHTTYKDQERINHLIVEAFSISLIQLIENILGGEFTDGELHFAFSKPEYWEKYRKHIHCNILFDQKQNKLLIPLKYKDVANISSDFTTYQLYKSQCQKQLDELDASKQTTADRVKKQLLLSPPGKSITEDDVAAAMFISKRTLSRRLTSESTSFRKIATEVMNSLAKSYLKETEIPIENIASLLNYHDSSSFRRAFKRANDIPPLAYRNQVKGRE